MTDSKRINPSADKRPHENQRGGNKGRMLTFEEMKLRAAEKEQTDRKRRVAQAGRRPLRSLAQGIGAHDTANRNFGEQGKLARHTTEPYLNPREEVAQLRERWANGENWLPVTAIAKRMGISRRRVYTLIQEGRIPAVNFGERLWRVRERDLLRYMEHCGRRSLEERGLDLGITGGRADRIRRKEDLPTEE